MDKRRSLVIKPQTLRPKDFKFRDPLDATAERESERERENSKQKDPKALKP